MPNRHPRTTGFLRALLARIPVDACPIAAFPKTSRVASGSGRGGGMARPCRDAGRARVRRVLGVVIVGALLGSPAAAYELREVRHVQVLSHDGIVLDGWLGFPTLAPDERAPAVLVSSPYYATCLASLGGASCLGDPSSEGWFSDGELGTDQSWGAVGILPVEWIRRGYVTANFSVRGTGDSGGCFSFGGFDEQRDQAVLVEWLGSQPWSNGNVGMGGLSYMGWTVWQAAVQAPPALKAIVSVAPVVDWYEWMFSPQGARTSAGAIYGPAYGSQFGFGFQGDPRVTAELFARRASCPHPLYPELVRSYATGRHDRDHYEERDFTGRLQDVTAAVLHTQGYADAGHVMQDRLLTAGLAPGVPFREIRTWLEHEFPSGAPLDLPTGESTWKEVVTGWFDHWLKGVGPRPPLGVLHRDEAARWFESAAWPPPESRPLAVDLSPGKFLSVPGAETAWFARMFRDLAPLGGGQSLCAPLASVVTWIPVPEEMTSAGNPSVDLEVESSEPGGLVSATLMAVAPGWTCGAPSPDVRWLASGAADLELDQSPYAATPFPAGGRAVHIDLSDVTATIPEGHRLAVVLSHGTLERVSLRAPLITIGPGSRAVLPVLRPVIRARS